MGHEWLTRLSALELIGDDPLKPSSRNDPRKHWTDGLAKNTDLSSQDAQREVARIKGQTSPDGRYKSAFKPVYDAIIGERWVDLGGFNVTKSMLGKYDAFDAVAQQPADVQYDHYMRRFDDSGPEGGMHAAARSNTRFVEYFVNAAMADPGSMRVYDGGIDSTRVEVDRNYFLFGRAVHLFQDSFSSEHTVRDPSNNYETVVQVKSYLCALGSEQHSHSKKDIVDYHSGDVIWNPGTQFDVRWSAYIPANMKTHALVATEASKDLWAAFIRTMGVSRDRRRAKAEAEASDLVNNWLMMDNEKARHWYDDPAHRDDTYVRASRDQGKGQTQSECVKKLGVRSGRQADKVKELEATQRICIYNIKAVDGSPGFDPSLHIPFDWEWKSTTKWETPPADWKIPDHGPVAGRRVKIKSLANDQYMTAPGGLANNELIYCRPGTPLEFLMFGEEDNCYLRLVDKHLFLSYRSLTGAAKLYDSVDEATYALEKQSNGAYAIKNIHHKQYMWLSDQSPYVTGSGSPKNINAQWVIEGLPGELKTRKVKIRSLQKYAEMTAPGGIANNSLIYCKPGSAIEFTMVGEPGNCFFKKDGLFLSYRSASGAVKLYDSPDEATYSLEKQPNGTYAIKNIHHQQYMWVSGESPYITGSGDPKKLSGQWIIDGLPGGVETRKVKIKNLQKFEYMTAPDGIENNSLIYCKRGAALDFTMVGKPGNCFFTRDGLFLSYRSASGAVKLYDSAEDATYSLEVQPNRTYAIKNIRHQQYMWLSAESPYITGSGKPSNMNAQWVIEGLGGPVDARRVKLKSRSNGNYMTAPGGMVNNSWIYCKAGTPIDFVMVGALNNCYFVKDGLFLSYRSTTGAVKLYDSPSEASYSLERQSNGSYAIKNIYHGQYIWLDGNSPYITRSGKPNKSSAQWAVEGL